MLVARAARGARTWRGRRPTGTASAARDAGRAATRSCVDELRAGTPRSSRASAREAEALLDVVAHGVGRGGGIVARPPGRGQRLAPSSSRASARSSAVERPRAPAARARNAGVAPRRRATSAPPATASQRHGDGDRHRTADVANVVASVRPRCALAATGAASGDERRRRETASAQRERDGEPQARAHRRLPPRARNSSISAGR